MNPDQKKGEAEYYVVGVKDWFEDLVMKFKQL